VFLGIIKMEQSKNLSIESNLNSPKVKKKKGKKKLTRSEKIEIRKNKKVNSFLKDIKLYENFTNKINYWLDKNYQSVYNLFSKLDDKNLGLVPLDMFKSGLKDLNCPVTNLEFDVIRKQLDPLGSGLISYKNFRAIKPSHDVFNSSHGADHLYTTTEKAKRSTELHPYHGFVPRFVKVFMKLATFHHFNKHPCHVEFERIHSNMQLSELCKLTARHSLVSTSQMSLYLSSKCKVEEKLDLELQVKDVMDESSNEVTFYYDYSVEFGDCPLLMAT